jgi:hypothetical protein
MPYDDPEGDDPHELVGVVLPGDEASTREMASAFEFAQLEWSREQIHGLFRNPAYAGAHGALQALGAEEIDRIVDEAVQLFGGFRVSVTEPDESRERAARRVRLRVTGQ